MISLWCRYDFSSTNLNQRSQPAATLAWEHCSTPADLFWRRSPKNLEELRSQAQLIVNINGGLMGFNQQKM